MYIGHAPAHCAPNGTRHRERILPRDAGLQCACTPHECCYRLSLRAGANYPTHLPFIKRPPKPLLLGYQGGDADDETTRRRGAQVHRA